MISKIRHFVFCSKYAICVWFALLMKDSDMLEAYSISLSSVSSDNKMEMGKK